MDREKKYKLLIKTFETSVRQHEMKGAFHPETHNMIEGNYKKAKKNLIEFLGEK